MELLQQLCTEEQYTEVLNFLNKTAKPLDLEGRSTIATNLRNVANQKFDAGDMNNEIFFRIAALHYLDFSHKELLELSPDEKREVQDIIVTELLKLSITMRRAQRTRQAITAADLALDMVGDLSRDDIERLQIDLYFNRALAKGEDRDFEGARKDASTIVGLSPAHEKAKQIMKNCRVAIRRERGPRADRWTGPLDQVPETDNEWYVLYFQIFSVVVALIGILTVQYAKYYGFQSEED